VFGALDSIQSWSLGSMLATIKTGRMRGIKHKNEIEKNKIKPSPPAD